MTEPGPQQVNTDEDQLWRAYIKNKSTLIRDQLIEFYTPFARSIAASCYARRVGNEIEFSEFMQNASLGLMESVDRFDPTYSVSFRTFASYRIKGSIYNALDHYSEKLQQIAYFRHRRNEQINSLNDKEQNQGQADTFQSIYDMTIGMAIGYMLEDAQSSAPSVQSKAQDVYVSYEFEVIKEVLMRIVEELPEREKTVIQLYYFKDNNFTDIANTMKLSKGRISQLHKKAIQMIMTIYRELGWVEGEY